LGRCVLENLSLQQLMNRAYPPPEGQRLPLQERITGGSAWVENSTFNIDAKAEEPSTVTQDQLRAMLRTLLKERFKLAFHTNTKEVTGYFLVEAKGGFKLKESAGPGAGGP